MGLDWSLQGVGRGGIHPTDFENNDITINAIDTLAPQGILVNFATLGETQLTAALSLLSSLNSAEVLSAPRIVTRSAPTDVPQIRLTSITPYIDSVQIQQDQDNDPTNNIIRPIFNQAEIGIVLYVYPLVTADNHVYLDIHPIISAITDRIPVQVQQTGTGSAADAAALEQFKGLGQPVGEVRESYNEVFLNNGETLVLGGFIRDELQTLESRVPLLSRLPLFGPLFKDTGKTKIKRTLLMFVTVNVLQTR